MIKINFSLVLAVFFVFANASPGFKAPTTHCEALEFIVLDFGIESMTGKGWDRVGVGQIGATRFTDRK